MAESITVNFESRETQYVRDSGSGYIVAAFRVKGSSDTTACASIKLGPVTVTADLPRWFARLLWWWLGEAKQRPE